MKAVNTRVIEVECCKSMVVDSKVIEYKVVEPKVVESKVVEFILHRTRGNSHARPCGAL